MWIVLLACADRDRDRDRRPEPPPAPPGVLVLAGGGAEGDDGDPRAWSARAYGALLEGGDVTGDGEVRVAVLSAVEESPWLPRYFEGLGADAARNEHVPDRAAAERVDLGDVDVVFLKGGDQGEYYDAWNGTALDAALRRLHRAGGGVGGTSAGAMSLAGVALAGGQDLVSADALEDACTRWLDDASDGGSGLHDDFLGLVPGLVVDTHATVRGRLGRMVGALARAVDDGLPADAVLGVDERTALVVRDGVGTVVGDGAAKLVVAGDAPPERRCGRPLRWTGLRLDALVEGWRLDLDTWAVTPGPDARAAAAWTPADNPPGAWSVDGSRRTDEERFAWVVERDRDPFAVRPGDASVAQADTVGITDAHAEDRRGPGEEALLAALAEVPGLTGFVVAAGGRLSRSGADVVVAEGRLATLVLDAGPVDTVDTSPSRAPADPGLRAAGLRGAVLHVLADGDRYDTAAHRP
jgi:cyanophycinase